MDDSRVRRALAWIDDARTSMESAKEILDEVGDELPRDNHLAAARISANMTIVHLQNWEAS